MGPFDKILVGVQVHKAQGHAAVLAITQDLALVAQTQVHLGERKAVRGLLERLEAVLCRRGAAIALGVRHDQAGARHAAAAHATAQLVQGRQAKALTVLDDHDGGVGHVDAHLDHRGRYEHVDLAMLEGSDHAVLLPRRHAAVKAFDGKSRQRQAQSVELGCRIVERHGHGHAALVVAGNTRHVFQLIDRVTRLHERANHVGLLTLFMRLANGAVGQVAARLGEHACRNARPRNRSMADDARVQVAVDRERQCARDGRRRHDEQVRTRAFGTQGIALAHTKAVLLVDDDKRKMLKRHVIRKDRVSAKEDVELARFQLRMDPLALGRRRGTRQERPGHASLREQGAGLIGILARQHSRRRHNAGLSARIGRDSQRASGDGRLAGTDVAKQQAVHHAPAIAHVVQDVLERGLLLVAQRKRQGFPERYQVLARGMCIRRYVDHTAIVAQAKRELQAETFLVGKTPPRNIALGHTRGKVN